MCECEVIRCPMCDGRYDPSIGCLHCKERERQVEARQKSAVSDKADRLDAPAAAEVNADGLLPCPFCGGKPEFWEGLGTQADITCSDCGGPCFGIQVSDVLSREERHKPANAFNMETLKYPDWVIEKVNAELKVLWNTRAPAGGGG